MSNTMCAQTIDEADSNSELWAGCITCQSKCCNHDIAHPLFVTDQEMEKIKALYPDKAEQFNKVAPCPFLMQDGLCMIHEVKPVDCRLFPFDIIRMGGEFYWIIRKIDCKITQDISIAEKYLKDMEENIIPDFAPHLDAYSLFRFDELLSKYDYEIIRKVNIYSKVEKHIFS